MNEQRVFADFHNADARGRLRLNTAGTMGDVARQKITLREGLSLTLYSEDLEADGRVQYSTEEKVWVAVIEWDAIRRSESQGTLPEAGTVEQRRTA